MTTAFDIELMQAKKAAAAITFDGDLVHEIAALVATSVMTERAAERMRCANIIASQFTEARDTEFDLGFETARKVFAAAILNSNK